VLKLPVIKKEATLDLENSEEAAITEDHIDNDSDQVNYLDVDVDKSIEAVTKEKVVPEKNDEDELQSLLNEVRQEATKNVSEDGLTTKHQKTNAEKRWGQLCGANQVIEKAQDAKKISFNPNNHLLHVVLNQIELMKENDEQIFRLKYNDLVIVIDYTKDKIYCNLLLTDDTYSQICYEEIDTKAVKIYDLDYSEVKLYQTKMNDNPEKAHSIESFIWSTSLLTSRGRLPEGTRVNNKVGLKVWPNLTRLELIPHAMNIAAVFSKHPGSLLEISKWLKIHQRYVFAFYNAAMSLDMIELNSSKLKTSKFNFDKKSSSKDSEQRGFLGRLLKRLKL